MVGTDETACLPDRHMDESASTRLRADDRECRGSRKDVLSGRVIDRTLGPRDRQRIADRNSWVFIQPTAFVEIYISMPCGILLGAHPAGYVTMRLAGYGGGAT
jgi:hypothetical protein